MSTIQSQLNILAAVNCGVHKRITELENNQISVKYNEESTEFCMGSKTKQIKYLGYKAYDAILSLNSDRYYLMDYKGKCEKIEDNEEDIFMYFNINNQNNNTINITITSIVNSNDDAININITTTTLQINSTKSELSSNNIIYYNINRSRYGFFKLTTDITIKCQTENKNKTENAIVTLNKNKYIKYESSDNYENIKFIDSTGPISDDDKWTLPPLN